ncbi:MAG: NAD(P)H-dependent oxidoreductase [Deltaproteobacteria bacterium]|nr:NAD(P)H-dependent oxidoreductase [Deltaproteobacteria bacterium]
MSEPQWHDLGPVEALKDPPLREIQLGKTKIALTFQNGTFGAISGICSHVGGPLGKGTLDGDYVICPWHYWRYHREKGTVRAGYGDIQVPSYELKIENGNLWVNTEAVTPRKKPVMEPHPLAREPKREAGPLRVVGISTTSMTHGHPRYSTSEVLLQAALARAAESGAETKMIRLSDLNFKNCEGYYSKSEHACLWPCSITQFVDADQLDQVYEALVHWADVTLMSTPIRWGSSSSLYHKMVERMNCVQNQITLHNRVLIQKKVAAFIITGGQDNIQSVAGEMLGFFSELGFVFPTFPFIAHSLGWSMEDMEHNIDYVEKSAELREGARALTDRSLEMAKKLLFEKAPEEALARGGRKGNPLNRLSR